MIDLKSIEAARSRIAEQIITTPCTRSETLSRLCGSTLFLKFENLQLTGSFKERGALNCLLNLPAEAKARGIIAASAGNHAQAVSFHAGRLGIPATIVMPERTPLIKVQNTRNFGAKVVLHGANFDEAVEGARAIEAAEKLAFVHPFDDDHIIAGQGTIGMELIEQNPYVQAVLVPIGGGGLISGIATAIKEVNPGIKIIGVETAVIPSMRRSIAEGLPVTLGHANTIADGIAVRRPAERTMELVQRYVDDIVTVDENEIANAILVLLEREKTVAEGAGAVPLAALLNDKIPSVRGKRVAMVLSGGNIDVNTLARIIERGLVKDGRLVRLKVRVPDRPGFLARMMTVIAEQGVNVLEVFHQRAFATQAALGETEIELKLETRGQEHTEILLAALAEGGWRAETLL